MLLVVDNGSVYTKSLIEFLDKKKIQFEQKISQSFDLNLLENYDSIILSGRRKNDKKINEINSKIVTFSIKSNTKLLGICYGAEILALTLGGTIRKISPQKGEETVEVLKENSIFSNPLNVFESHSFEISKLPKSLITIGKSKNCKHEIIQYKNKPIYGTQFHPEMSPNGHNLLENFCSL